MVHKQPVAKQKTGSPAQASKYLFKRDRVVNKFLKAFLAEDPEANKAKLAAIATRSCREGSPLMIADLMAKANLMMKGDEATAKAVEGEIQAQMDALSALTSAMLRYGYDTDSMLYRKFARDYRFLDTLLCYIKSEIEVARSIKKSGTDEKTILLETEQKRLEFIDKLQKRMSGARITTFLASISTMVGVPTAMVFKDFTTWLQATFPQAPALALGFAFVVAVSAASIATNALIDFYTMVSRNTVISRTRAKIRDVLEWEQNEIGKKLANVYIMAMGLAAKFEYNKDVNREFPALANAVKAEDWATVRKMIDSAIRAISEAGEAEKEGVARRFGDFVSQFRKKPGCEATQHCGKCAEMKPAGKPRPEPPEDPVQCGKCLGEHALLQAKGYSAGQYTPPEEKKQDVALIPVPGTGPMQ